MKSTMKSAFAKILTGTTALLSLSYMATGVLAAPDELEPPEPTQEQTKPVNGQRIPIFGPKILPDGVADVAGKFAYLRHPEGGVEAIEIATGKTKWTTKTLSKPLIALLDRLVVQVPVEGQANALKIAILDGATGKQTFLSDALVFPDWVVVAAEDGTINGKNFSVKTRIHDNELSLMWQASTHYAGGAAPSPEVEAAAKNESGGVFLVGLKKGKLLPPQIPIVSGLFQSKDHLKDMAYVSLDEMYGLTKASVVGKNKRTWAIMSTTGDGKTGEIELERNPDAFAVLGSKIFWVTSTQPEGSRLQPGEVTRELTVAEIATGKILWKRALKPRQIVPLPM